MSSKPRKARDPDGEEQRTYTSSKTPVEDRFGQAATVYDAVAGRYGVNGLMTHDQMVNQNRKPLTADEVLLRRNDAPNSATSQLHNPARHLDAETHLPDSDLLKDMHAYVSHFYGSSSAIGGEYDFNSMDETALLAMAILLEESMREALGETGDLALTEAEGLEQGLPPSKILQHQVLGRVVPQPVEEYSSPSPMEVQEPTPGRGRKRRRRHLADVI